MQKPWLWLPMRLSSCNTTKFQFVEQKWMSKGVDRRTVRPQNLHRRKQRKRLWRLLPKAKFGRNDRILLGTAKKRRVDFAFSTCLGQVRLWQSTGLSFTTALLRILFIPLSNKKVTGILNACYFFGRNDRIRTCDIVLPNKTIPIFCVIFASFWCFLVRNRCFRVLLKALFPRSPNL